MFALTSPAVPRTARTRPADRLAATAGRAVATTGRALVALGARLDTWTARPAPGRQAVLAERTRAAYQRAADARFRDNAAQVNPLALR